MCGFHVCCGPAALCQCVYSFTYFINCIDVCSCIHTHSIHIYIECVLCEYGVFAAVLALTFGPLFNFEFNQV